MEKIKLFLKSFWIITFLDYLWVLRATKYFIKNYKYVGLCYSFEETRLSLYSRDFMRKYKKEFKIIIELFKYTPYKVITTDPFKYRWSFTQKGTLARILVLNIFKKYLTPLNISTIEEITNNELRKLIHNKKIFYQD